MVNELNNFSSQIKYQEIVSQNKVVGPMLENHIDFQKLQSLTFYFIVKTYCYFSLIKDPIPHFTILLKFSFD